MPSVGQMMFQLVAEDKATGQVGKVASAIGQYRAKTEKDLAAVSSSWQAMWRTVSYAAGSMAVSLAGSTVAASKFAWEMENMARRTGMSSKELQKWDYVSRQSGVQLSVWALGLRFLQRNIEKTPEKFAQWGVQIRNADGSMRSLNEIIYAVSDTMRGYVERLGEQEGKTKANLMAWDLMGRGGARLTQVYAEGSERLRELNQEFEATGGAIPTEDLAKLYPRLLDLQKQARYLKLELGEGLSPAFVEIAQALTPMLKSMIEWTHAHSTLIAQLAKVGAFVMFANALLRVRAGLVGATEAATRFLSSQQAEAASVTRAAAVIEQGERRKQVAIKETAAAAVSAAEAATGTTLIPLFPAAVGQAGTGSAPQAAGYGPWRGTTRPLGGREGWALPYGRRYPVGGDMPRSAAIAERMGPLTEAQIYGVRGAEANIMARAQREAATMLGHAVTLEKVTTGAMAEEAQKRATMARAMAQERILAGQREVEAMKAGSVDRIALEKQTQANLAEIAKAGAIERRAAEGAGGPTRYGPAPLRSGGVGGLGGVVDKVFWLWIASEALGGVVNWGRHRASRRRNLSGLDASRTGGQTGLDQALATAEEQASGLGARGAPWWRVFGLTGADKGAQRMERQREAVVEYLLAIELAKRAAGRGNTADLASTARKLRAARSAASDMSGLDLPAAPTLEELNSIAAEGRADRLANPRGIFGMVRSGMQAAMAAAAGTGARGDDAAARQQLADQIGNSVSEAQAQEFATVKEWLQAQTAAAKEQKLAIREQLLAGQLDKDAAKQQNLMIDAWMADRKREAQVAQAAWDRYEAATKGQEEAAKQQEAAAEKQEKAADKHREAMQLVANAAIPMSRLMDAIEAKARAKGFPNVDDYTRAKRDLMNVGSAMAFNEWPAEGAQRARIAGRYGVNPNMWHSGPWIEAWAKRQGLQGRSDVLSQVFSRGEMAQFAGGWTAPDAQRSGTTIVLNHNFTVTPRNFEAILGSKRAQELIGGVVEQLFEEAQNQGQLQGGW